MILNREMPPKSNSEISFRLPRFQKLIYSNGMKAVLTKKDNLPIIQLALVINAGSKFDPRGKSGLAYLTAQLIDEGAGNLSSLELDEEFESLGTVFGVSTDSDSIVISILSLQENFPRSLELLSMVFNSPTFNDTEFRREQKKLLSKITQQNDDPSYIATVNFDKIVFHGTPYENPIIGNKNDVTSITKDDVKSFYSDFFTTNNAQLFIVGNFDEVEIKSLIEQFFPERINAKTETNIIVKQNLFESKIYYINKPNAAQSEIRIGHFTGTRNEADYFPKLLANSILGGQFSSRLNLKLREDKGYTYGIHSAFAYYKDAGHFEISTSVNGQNTGDAIKEILNELKLFQNNISDKEIDFVKSYLIKRFPAMFESYSQMVHNLATLKKYNLPDDYFDNYIRSIKNCKKDDILTSAKEGIKLENLVILIVGDKKTILPQLEKFSGYDIIELNRI